MLAFDSLSLLPDPTLSRLLRHLADDLDNVKKDAFPERAEVVLTDWALMERAVPCLVGRTVGHPHILDNRVACTSQLFHLDGERGIAHTLSRWYRLGPVKSLDPILQ